MPLAFDEDFDDDDSDDDKFWHTITMPNSKVTVFSSPNESWLQEINQRLDKIVTLLEQLVYRI